MEYGEAIDNTNSKEYGEVLGMYDPTLSNMYTSINTYFNNPVLTKIKDIDSYSMYMCKTYCLLNTACRYIIVFVSQDSHEPDHKERLADMEWVSLQTRTLFQNHNIPSHSYQPRRLESLNTAIITRTSVTADHSLYECDKYPILVTLLHSDKGQQQYQPTGNLISALETYNTILSLQNV